MVEGIEETGEPSTYGKDDLESFDAEQNTHREEPVVSTLGVVVRDNGQNTDDETEESVEDGRVAYDPPNSAPHEITFFKYGCCVSYILWILITTFIFIILVIIGCCMAAIFVKWVYKRRIRKRVETLKQKYHNEERGKQEQEHELFQIAKRHLAQQPMTPKSQMVAKSTPTRTCTSQTVKIARMDEYNVTSEYPFHGRILEKKNEAEEQPTQPSPPDATTEVDEGSQVTVDSSYNKSRKMMMKMKRIQSDLLPIRRPNSVDFPYYIGRKVSQTSISSFRSTQKNVKISTIPQENNSPLLKQFNVYELRKIAEKQTGQAETKEPCELLRNRNPEAIETKIVRMVEKRI